MERRRKASRWEEMFGLDYRSLALARVILGVTILCDLINRVKDLETHYTDHGVHPREYAFAPNGLYICFHMMNGETVFQAALFIIHAIIAVAFTVGYRTRLASIGLYLMTSSLWARNQFILYGGYVLMRLLTTWFMFLPMGKAWSLDSALKRDPAAPPRSKTWHVSGFSAAFILQMAIIYISSGWHKTGDEWRVHGTSAFYAVSLDYFRWGLGEWLLPHTDLLRLLTFGTLWWELYGPLLFSLPFWTQPARFVGVMGFWFMHLGLCGALRLGVFLPTFTAALAALLPADVWDDWVIPLLSTPDRCRLKIQYNAASPFARTLAQLSRLVLVPQTHIEAQTIEADSPKDAQFKVTNFRNQTHSSTAQAIAEIVAFSPLTWPLAPLLRSEAVVEIIDSFALRQYEAEKHRSRHQHPAPPRPRRFPRIAAKILKRAAFDFLGVLLGIAVLSWCFGNVGYVDYTTPDQSWNLFAPRPPPIDFWYTFEGELEDGTEVELWQNGVLYDMHPQPRVPRNASKPVPFVKPFGNSRWYKWFENVNEAREDILLPFGRWICRTWNAKYEDEERLYQFKIWWISEWNHPNGTNPRAGENLLWHHICYDRPATAAPAADEKQEAGEAKEKEEKAEKEEAGAEEEEKAEQHPDGEEEKEEAEEKEEEEERDGAKPA